MPVHSRGSAAAIVLFLLLPWIAGCQQERLTDVENLRANIAVSSASDLGQTMKYVDSVGQFEMGEFRNKVNSGLNRWISVQNAETRSSGWTLDPLANELPEPIREHAVFTTLSEESFLGNDASYLQQCLWIEKIAERIANDYTPLNHEYFLRLAVSRLDEARKQEWKNERGLLEKVVAELNPGIGTEGADGKPSAAAQLARAMELFDWTVRNVQLLDAKPWPTPEMLPDLALKADVSPEHWPPDAGAMGPGYARYPWQVLTYGKGDYLERAHLFALLCHAAEIPVVLLATEVEEGSSRPYQEWICGVIIGQEMYLFDTLLGIPLIGEEPGSIATLAQVREKPELLERLDLTPEESVESRPYRVRGSQLDGLIALVVAEPESLSKRMNAVHRSLTGEDRLNLVSRPTEIAEQIAGWEGIGRVALWHIPFSVAQFRENVTAAFNRAGFDTGIQKKLSWFPEEELYVDTFPMFRTARNLYLRGVFETNRQTQERSALSYYFRFMYTDEDIAQIDQDPQLQGYLGIRQAAGQSANSWSQQLSFVKDNMSKIRADAAFFMSLAHFERGNPQPALNWLDNQLPNMDTTERWEPWREYQRGRAYESSGDYQSALESYLRDGSAQRPGSIIRARWMRELEKLESPTAS